MSVEVEAATAWCWAVQSAFCIDRSKEAQMGGGTSGRFCFCHVGLSPTITYSERVYRLSEGQGQQTEAQLLCRNME